MPWWVRLWYHSPLIDRYAYEWMWFHGGFLVFPPDHPLSIHGPPPGGIRTERLEVRPPTEVDRERLVTLFQDPEFMVFSGGVHDFDSAHARFDVMLRTAVELPFAKQPVIELATNTIVGYSGVAWFEFAGERRLEFGYRLVPEARGKGYATEAGRALIALAAESFHGEMLAMVDPTNEPSMNVITKLGFTFWKQAEVDGYLDNLYRQTFS
jgi:RimJ/RimL family protein N-acetyltransferase